MYFKKLNNLPNKIQSNKNPITVISSLKSAPEYNAHTLNEKKKCAYISHACV